MSLKREFGIPYQFVSPDLHEVHPDIGDATKYFYETNRQRIAMLNANVIIEIIGMAGVSKSWSALTLWDLFNTWGGHRPKSSDVPNSVSFSFDDCQNQIDASIDGQCFLADERPRQVGLMSETSEEALENIIDVVRKKRISLILVSPTERHLPFYMFQLTALGILYERRTGVFLCKSMNNKIYGLVQIPAPRSELIRPYEKAKDVFLDKIVSSGGATGVSLRRIVDKMLRNPKVLRCRGMPKVQLDAVIAVETEPPLPTQAHRIIVNYIWGKWQEEDMEKSLSEGKPFKFRSR